MFDSFLTPFRVFFVEKQLNTYPLRRFLKRSARFWRERQVCTKPLSVLNI